MLVSLCLSVREHISGTTIFTKLLCMLPMAVARSSSGGVAIRYVLLVFRLTSFFCSKRKGVYSKLLSREQHGFDTATHTLTDSPGAALVTDVYDCIVDC